METEIGPVEYIMLAFPGNRFKGEIVPALAELVDNETNQDHRSRLREEGRGWLGHDHRT